MGREHEDYMSPSGACCVAEHDLLMRLCIFVRFCSVHNGGSLFGGTSFFWSSIQGGKISAFSTPYIACF